MNKSLFKRNPSLFVAICVVLFIPLVVAVIFAFTVDPYSLDDSIPVTKVSIKQPDGKLYESESADVIATYKDMNINATEINSDYDDFSTKEFYEITFYDSNSTPLVYKFYPSTDADNCVYASPDNKYFIVNKEAAEKIIQRAEFSSIDTENLLPVFTVSGLGEKLTVSPDSYDWTYKALDGSLSNLKDETKADNPTVKFDASENGKLVMDFTKKPDSLAITIKAGGEILFNDKYENLADVTNLHYEKDTKLTLSAFAEWYKLDDSEYYGSAKYSFDLLYDCAPSYTLVDKSLNSGDFTILKLTDFNDGELLGITSDIGLAKKIPVYDYKGSKITFIPLTSTLSEGDHEIGLATESGHTDTAKIAVRTGSAKYKKQTLIVDVKKEKEDNDTQLSDSLTQKALDDFGELVKKYSAESVNEQLFTGEKFRFSYPTGSNKTTAGGAEYGMTRTVTNRNAVNLSYVAHGDDMACTKGQDIKCANSGKVVFADNTTLLGNTVIIDHGFGILTYYGKLESISVKQGDSVTKDQTVVGKAGSTGFAAKLGGDGVTVEKTVTCHYAVSLNGSFIDPRCIANGIYID